MWRILQHKAAAPSTSVAAAAGSRRRYSDSRSSISGAKQDPWPEQPVYPSARSPFPHSKPRFRRTHIEWMLHHGHGDRHSKFGPTREIPDFEYADGTPSAASPGRYAFKHHQDHLLVQLIRAGAAVERFEMSGMLPRIPGVPEQRDWDPEIPLFLEDVDERGRQPIADVTQRMVDERFTEHNRTPINLAKNNAAKDLEPNTMFATYDPAAFVSDSVKADVRKPYWSRRRWALSNNFMVPVSPKAKNTIADE